MSQEPSINGSRITRATTADGKADLEDHEISLIDATISNDALTTGPSNSENAGWRQLARNATQTSVRDHLARRKYARWRQERFDSKEGSIRTGNEVGNSDTEQEQQEHSRGRVVEVTGQSSSDAIDYGFSAEPQKKPQINGKPKKHNDSSKHTEKEEEEYTVDILYENQRGSFFCGIPLYSHSSLLNFDPSPWVNKDYKTSPVNITNAQVPDPSWQWSWKHWYVDMTDDVDEDGWQYSFAFFGKFSWHGTHPWFHSFCRRRRWLRKRTRIAHLKPGKPLPSSMSAAHKLNTDYFTIHTKRDQSPVTIDGGPKTARPDSYVSYRSAATADELPDDIDDIGSLFKALRLAAVDRQKLDAVSQFIDLGGEELVYLKTDIPAIMQFLVFHSSRKQFLEILRTKSKQAQDKRGKSGGDKQPEDEAETRRIDNLSKAVEAADAVIKGLEAYSDQKKNLKKGGTADSSREDMQTAEFEQDDDDELPDANENPAGVIPGISRKAEIGTSNISETTYRGATLAPAKDAKPKKTNGAEEDDEDDKDTTKNEGSDPEDIERLPTRLGRDQIAIPESEENREQKTGNGRRGNGSS